MSYPSSDVPPQSGPTALTFAEIVSGAAVLGATTSTQVVDTFLASAFRACKYILTVSQGSTYQVTELLVLTDGTNTFLQVYGAMATPGVLIADFSTTFADGAVTLSVALTTPVAGTLRFQAFRIFV